MKASSSQIALKETLFSPTSERGLWQTDSCSLSCSLAWWIVDAFALSFCVPRPSPLCCVMLCCRRAVLEPCPSPRWLWARWRKSLYWEVFPSMATERVYCTPVLWAGRLYVLGGCSENGLPLDSAEVLDLESQHWCELPPLPTARAGASAVAIGDQLMVMGGMDAQQSPLASVEVYHPDEGKWERKTGLGQASMGITTLEKGKNSVSFFCFVFLLCWKDCTGQVFFFFVTLQKSFSI